MIAQVKRYRCLIGRYLMGRLSHKEFSDEYVAEGKQDEQIAYSHKLGKAIYRLWSTAELYQPDLTIRQGLFEQISEEQLLFEARETFITLKKLLLGLKPTAIVPPDSRQP